MPHAGDYEIEVNALRALAHPVRLAIMGALAGQEACVCHLSTLTAKPQPYVSKQLAELRAAGMVRDRRDGQRVYYSLANRAIADLLAAASAVAGRTPPPVPMVLDGCPCPNCQTRADDQLT